MIELALLEKRYAVMNIPIWLRTVALSIKEEAETRRKNKEDLEKRSVTISLASAEKIADCILGNEHHYGTTALKGQITT